MGKTICRNRDYYHILGVDRTASKEEIRARFKTLVKKPGPGGKSEKENRLRELTVAYRVLGNPRERARYDALRQTLPPKNEDASKKEAQQNYALKLLNLLLRGEKEEALRTYEAMREEGFNLEEHLEHNDFLDCTFLLGELLEGVQRHQEAAGLYEDLYRREKEPPQSRYFADELELRLKKLYSRTLPQSGNKSPREQRRYYEKMFRFGLNRGEKAFIHKKMAESYLREGLTRKARKALGKALELKPNLKGTVQLREALTANAS